MIGATLYLAGKEADGSPIYDAKPCLMCERLIVNAGIKRVISRKENCMTELLKPCPFCGSKARLMAMGYGDKKLYGIFCTTDLKQEYQHGHFIDNYSDKEEAITAWNTRANKDDKDKKGGDNP